MSTTAGQIETHAGLQVRRLGLLGYAAALALQREVNHAVSVGELPATLLLISDFAKFLA